MVIYYVHIPDPIIKLIVSVKIKPPIADFLYPPRGFKGVEPSKISPLLTFWRHEVLMQKVALKTVLPIWAKCEKNKTKMVPFEKSANIL